MRAESPDSLHGFLLAEVIQPLEILGRRGSVRWSALGRLHSCNEAATPRRKTSDELRAQKDREAESYRLKSRS
jgi:hypothetical protein